MSRTTQQIKSRKNVRERGEVFTAEREVKAMCDLVGKDIADREKRVLEPAAGNGNFLVEILRRRIDNIDTINGSGKPLSASAKNDTNGKKESERAFCLLVALSNIYAVELDKENVTEARQRLREMMIQAVNEPAQNYLSAVDALLESNIICGNFLTTGKGAVPIYEYIPNYETQTFDIAKHTLHEINPTSRKRQVGIEPAEIGTCIKEWFKPKKIKTLSNSGNF